MATPVQFIPMYIRQTIADPNGFIVRSDRWNALWNLNIQQGDNNAQGLDTLTKSVNALRAEYDGTVVNTYDKASVDKLLSVKENKTVTALHVKNVTFDKNTGVFTFTKEDGSFLTIDTALERVVLDVRLDPVTSELVLTLADGTEQRVSLAAFINTYTFKDSATISWSKAGNAYTPQLVPGSIKMEHLGIPLQDTLTGYVNAAAGSATLAEQHKTAAANSASQSASSAADAQASKAAAALSAANVKSSEDAAALSKTAAAASAATAEQHKTAAAASAALARQISQQSKGYFATPKALTAAYPTAAVGDWAIVGSTDTNWVWDDATGAWRNTMQAIDLADYYTKAQADAAFLGKTATAGAATKLSASRKIGDALFDGSKDITLEEIGCGTLLSGTKKLKLFSVILTSDTAGWCLLKLPDEATAGLANCLPVAITCVQSQSTVTTRYLCLNGANAWAFQAVSSQGSPMASTTLTFMVLAYID